MTEEEKRILKKLTEDKEKLIKIKKDNNKEYEQIQAKTNPKK